MSSSESWQAKALDKRTALQNLIPPEWRLPDSMLNNLPKNLTTVPVQCGILSSLDVEITEIDDLHSLAQCIANGKYSAVQVTEAFCKRAAIAHQLANCLAEICFSQALERARYLDEYYQSTGGKTLGPLHGVPISLKDQFNVQGCETAMAYIGYLGEIAERNSVIVDVVLSLGAVVYVKTALPQTVMLGETRSNLLGLTVNPLNRELSCGGSSGGEGCLIALKGSVCGLGTDIGGSVRFPAALNGICGLKPSDGRLPYGLAKNSLDGLESVASVIGPMARSLASLQFFFKAVLDTQPWLVDPGVHNIPWRDELFHDGQLPKLCFGVIRFDQKVHLSPPVQRALDMSIEALERAGHQVIEWDTADHPQGIDILVKMYQGDGGKDVQQALQLSGEPLITGAFVGSPETELTVYETWRLHVARRAFALQYWEKWNQTAQKTSTGRPVDGILSPVVAVPAYPHEYDLSIGYTGIANLLQLSSVVLPITRVDAQLDQVTAGSPEAKDAYPSPDMYENCSVGLQIICRRLEDEKVLGMAMVLERALQAQV